MNYWKYQFNLFNQTSYSSLNLIFYESKDAYLLHVAKIDFSYTLNTDL